MHSKIHPLEEYNSVVFNVYRVFYF
jgi:hypothetical protein